MNESGRAVKYWMDKEKITLENILVILDDLALPLNKLRLRPGGSDAGHNGLRSIQEHLGTDTWPRLRLGIGNNFPRGRQVDFVLGRWSADELPVVQHKVQKSVEIIESFATIGIERTMSQYNKLEFEL
jgi:PTH1 family peptidyl-tRNA hydrolase